MFKSKARLHAAPKLVHQDIMTRRFALFFLATAALALSACTQFPDLEHTRTDALKDAEYPALVPIEPILAAIEPPGTLPDETTAGINTRLAALRGRAEGLRGDVLSADDKRRLAEGLR